jgi:riboflavin biosynthesis pyrimidine reductase
MSQLDPLESLFDATEGWSVPLPPALAALYGRLRFPIHSDRPHVLGNFVSTLDGVVSLGVPGMASGRAISGANPHDQMVMGLLRATADAVIIGAGTFRGSARRRWTAEAVYPPLAGAFRDLRAKLGKSGPPLTVVVTAGGELDLDRSPGDPDGPPHLVMTTAEGAARLGQRVLPPTWAVAANAGPLTAEQTLRAVRRACPSTVILVEGGPTVMGAFIGEGCLDELFLTIAPQIAGRDASEDRPGFVAGARFAPDDPQWATLVSLKRAGSFLFTRYALASTTGPPNRDTRLGRPVSTATSC